MRTSVVYYMHFFNIGLECSFNIIKGKVLCTFCYVELKGVNNSVTHTQ